MSHKMGQSARIFINGLCEVYYKIFACAPPGPVMAGVLFAGDDACPSPVVDHEVGRQRVLSAFEQPRFGLITEH